MQSAASVTSTVSGSGTSELPLRHAAYQEQNNQHSIDHARIPSSSTAEPSSPRLTAQHSEDDTRNGNMYKPSQAYSKGDVQEDELPALQANRSSTDDHLDPISSDDPRSFDLVAPPEASAREEYSLEKTSQTLFSSDHLRVIFADSSFLLRFTTFLGTHRPQSVPLLVHYLDCLKAIRTIHYANAISEGLDPVEGLDFTSQRVEVTVNTALEARANAAFDVLVKEDLPAYITHTYIGIVSASITARITGALSPHLREASEGLAEVFCLTDPSRQDNPIVFASEEFNRTTQYGMGYILGRNCRFLQGPMTNPTSVRRLRDSIAQGRQHQEVFLNYRRDGSPFMNLLMIAPLCDSRGIVRYHIGAQVDVSGLVKECSDLESLQRLLELQARGEMAPDQHKVNSEKDDELRELAEMLNGNELGTIRRFGGRMHRDGGEEGNGDGESGTGSMVGAGGSQQRLLIKDPNTLTPPLGLGAAAGVGGASGKLSGIYQHYLLVRPFPSLRILFASPSQRVPGVLQSPFMNKIGGSNRVREELTTAFAEGRGVTAKVKWVSGRSRGGTDGNWGGVDDEGRNKWIHCTPLLGQGGKVGVWMVVIVDDERERLLWGGGGSGTAGGRMAPSVMSHGHGHSQGQGSGSERNGYGRDYASGNYSMPNVNGYTSERGSATGSGVRRDMDDGASIGGYSQTSLVI